MKGTLKDILRIACISLLLLLIYVVCDIFDLPSRIGIPVQYINWDAAGLLCGNLVVIALFAITYRALDKRSIQKEHNQRQVALYMLRTTLNACSAQINLLKDNPILLSTANMTDFNKPADDSSLFQRLLTTPFEDHEAIVNFASNGVITEIEYFVYHSARNTYLAYITTVIVYHGEDNIKLVAQEKVLSTLQSAIEVFKT